MPHLTLLLRSVAASDQQAFRELFHLYAGKVHSFAYKLTRSDDTADEIVQDVFMKLWMGREALSSVEFFPSYLYTITRNHAFNILKRMAREAQAKAAWEKTVERSPETTEETVIQNDYQHLLDNAINKLPPKQRLVYSMCHREGMKYEEVANRLNISRLTVKTHMQQALRTIKAHFGSAIGIWLLALISLA